MYFAMPIADTCTRSAMSALSAQIWQDASLCIIPASPRTARLLGACERCFNSPTMPCFTLMSVSGSSSCAISGARETGGLIKAIDRASGQIDQRLKAGHFCMTIRASSGEVP